MCILSLQLIYQTPVSELATKKGREKGDMLKVCQANNELEHTFRPKMYMNNMYGSTPLTLLSQKPS